MSFSSCRFGFHVYLFPSFSLPPPLCLSHFNFSSPSFLLSFFYTPFLSFFNLSFTLHLVLLFHFKSLFVLSLSILPLLLEMRTDLGSPSTCKWAKAKNFTVLATNIELASIFHQQFSFSAMREALSQSWNLQDQTWLNDFCFVFYWSICLVLLINRL